MALPTSCEIRNPSLFTQFQGVDKLTAAGDKTIIAAPGAGKFLRIQKIIVSISVPALNCVIALEDGAGGTRLWQVQALGTEVWTFCSRTLDFGESGLQLSKNTALNLTVETANATVYCLAIGYTQG